MNVDNYRVLASSDVVKTNLEKNKNVLGKDDFLKLLVTQLRNQDPLNPMEDRDFIAQTAQFSTLEQMQNLSETMKIGLDNLLYLQEHAGTYQAIFNSMNLVGKEIEAVNEEGKKVSGIVEKVNFTDKGAFAVIKGEKINVFNIISASQPATPEVNNDD